MSRLIEQKNAVSIFRDALFDILLFGNGMKDMLTLAENYLGDAVFLYDINYNIISESPEAERHQEHVKKNAHKSHLNDTEVSRMKKYNVLGELEKHSGAFIAQDKDYPEIRWMLCAVRIKGAFIGYLISPDQKGHGKYTERKLEILTQLSQALSVELQKGDIFSYKTGIKYSYFLTNLINGEFESESIIHSRMEILEKETGRYHRMICISSPDMPEENEFHPSIIEQSRNCFPNAISAMYDGNLILLVNERRPFPDYENRFEDLKEVLTYHHLKAGISQEYSDLVDTPMMFRAAYSSLLVGIKMHLEDPLFFSEDLLFYQLLNTAENADLKALLYGPYNKIKLYDHQYHTDYLSTLETLLKCGRSHSEAASFLHIHRSTLFYRLKAIEERFHISLSDSETLFALELSFRIDKFISS